MRVVNNRFCWCYHADCETESQVELSKKSVITLMNSMLYIYIQAIICPKTNLYFLKKVTTKSAACIVVSRLYLYRDGDFPDFS